MVDREVSQGQSKAKEQALRHESQKKDPNWMTQETHDRLVREQEVARKQLIEISDYMSQGGRIHGSDDYRDQAAYEKNKTDLGLVHTTLNRIDSILENYRIISPRTQTDKIKRGNTAIVQFEGDSEATTVTLLGQYDAATHLGWTHPGTPVGGAILEKKAGERVPYMVGREQRFVTILEILPGQFEGPRESSQNPQSS